MKLVDMINIIFNSNYSELKQIILSKYGNIDATFKELADICYDEQVKWLETKND